MNLTEHDMARTMARHNFTFALPLDYRPPALPKPLGEMIVTVKSAVQLWKKFCHHLMQNLLFGCNSLPLLLLPVLKCSCILAGMSLVLDKATISAFCQLCSRTYFSHVLPRITELTSGKVTAAMLFANPLWHLGVAICPSTFVLNLSYFRAELHFLKLPFFS